MDKTDKRREVIIYRDWCKKCGICWTFCPTHTIVKSDDGGPVVPTNDTCIGCRQCEIRCPEFAIEVNEEDAT